MQVLLRVLSWVLIYGLVKDTVVFFKEDRKVDWYAVAAIVLAVLTVALLPLWVFLLSVCFVCYVGFLAVGWIVKLTRFLWGRWVKHWLAWMWKLGKGILVYALIGAVCGVVFFLIVGSMGLALLGTAVGIGAVPMVAVGVIVALAVMGLVNTWKKHSGQTR